ncbi:HD-GYP domain-containing protein [Paenibacillus sp. SYP-B3998]|uniref:HD-GYP domain-containing protein n=1 Tax=Paenibacillus sp. SYP-B3998 TaxID=2678564 RepID=A0A6G4A1I8_9BACL|nr:HD-GYP domain-containing protein [Paenibacillus sp. SYP-B3998]NEW07804.1 HD-GYP domain-containing protein [Paenibacillus sp. SYP-B3998]
MRIHVLQLIVGDKLISDSYNSVGLHLLSSGTVLDAGDILMLNRHNIDYVDILPRETEDPEQDERTQYQVTPEQSDCFHKAIDGIKQLFKCAGFGDKLVNNDVETAFNPLIQSFQGEKDVVSLLLSLNSQDDYTYQHSVQVGMLSYYMAKWMYKSDKEALLIGKAGYLHDIGKSKIDPSILEKPGKLTNDEYNEIKKHTIYGYEIIRDSLQDNTIALVALQHHERFDGSGYPMRRTKTEIHSYSTIIAVADVYSAMISNRVYQESRDLLFVLKELHRMSFGQLDPKITQIFIRNMIPNFIGKKVSLSDGRAGTIVMTNPSDFFRPLIKIKNEFVDLSQLNGVEITQIAM